MQPRAGPSARRSGSGPRRSCRARARSSGPGRWPWRSDPSLHQVSEWSEIEVEVLVGEAELLLQLLHALVQLHERAAEALGLLLVERAGLHAPERLALHQLSEEIDHGQHEPGEAALDVLRVGVDAEGCGRVIH